VKSSQVWMTTLLVFLGTAWAAGLYGQTDPPPDAAQRRISLETLTVLGSALYVGAHPDDENAAVLAWLAKGRKVRIGYLSLTRGSGGQNLIGSEQGDLLGVLRTEELLAARRIDGAEQFFTRAVDFGYSKGPEETLRIWGHDAVLSDIVWVIRSFRPDVIITRFPGNGAGGHGHHTASAILTREAFYAAADPNRFPGQLAYVQPWQAKRLLWNVFQWHVPGAPPPPTATPELTVDLGAYDPVLGESYGEVAAASRTMHKSQGVGSSPRRGSLTNSFELLAGEPARDDIFDGMDVSWKRIPGGETVGNLLAKAVAVYSDENPAASVPALLEALAAIDRLAPDPWVSVKRREVVNMIKECTGLWVDAVTEEPSVSPGASVSVEASALNRSPVPLALVRIEPSVGPATPVGTPLPYNKVVGTKLSLAVPAGTPYSQPYWLETPHGNGLYVVTDQRLIGRPESPPPLTVTFVVRVGGQDLAFSVPVVQRWTDPVEGERSRELPVVPRVTVNLETPVLIFPTVAPKVVRAVVRSHEPEVSASVRLAVPAGWRVAPEAVPLSFDKPDEERTVHFTVTPPEGAATGELVALVRSGPQEEPARSLVRVDHPHIVPQTLLPPASAKLVRVEVACPVRRIGYVMGPGDDVPEVLRQLGFEVTLLSDDQLEEGDLAHFDAIVIGVRAYNTRPSLAASQDRLMAFVQAGGKLVVQYNTNRNLVTERLGPYPFSLSHDRVTDETAPVTILTPGSALLTVPERIASADFAGWVQERGLYFPSSWDEHYQTPFAMADPGEAVTKGALLYANYGKGGYVYTGLAFFRQLPAGVPGAIRLFVNLLAGGVPHG
jgi:LmbE family N-acetylglucosaminyl deacetylase